MSKGGIEHKGAVTGVFFSRDSATLASTSADKTICLWDAHTGRFLLRLEGHTDTVTAVMWSPDDSVLASSSHDTTIRLWDTKTYTSSVLKGHKGLVYYVSFSNDGKRMVSASADKTARVWDVATRSCIKTISSHKKEVIVAKFCKDDSSILTISHDMSVQLYDLIARKSVTLWSFSQYHNKAMDNNRLPWAIKTVANVAGWTGKDVGKLGFNYMFSHWKSVTPIGLIFADQICVLRDLKPTTIPPFLMHPDCVTLAFSSNGSRLAIGSLSNDISIYDPNIDDVDWMEVTMNLPRTEVLAVSDDGSRILAVSDLGTSLLDWKGTTVADLSPKGFSIGNIVRKPAQPSKDFSTIALPSRVKNAIHLFDGSSGAKLPDLIAKGMFVNISVIAFSPDDELIVSGSLDCDLKIWSRKEMKLLHTLDNISHYKGEITRVAFAPDGKTVAAGNEHGAVLRWSFNHGRVFTVSPDPHPVSVTALVYSPDCSYIVSAASDGSLRSWQPDTALPPFQRTTTATPPKSLTFQIMSDFFRLYCRSELGAVEIWEFHLPESTKAAAGPDKATAESDGAVAESDGAVAESDKAAAGSEKAALNVDQRTLDSDGTVVDASQMPVEPDAIDETEKPARESEKPTVDPATPAEEPEKHIGGPRASWRTNPGCIFADQPFDSNISLDNKGWLVDGEARLCWLPKHYRPRDTTIFYRRGRLTSILTEGDSLLIIDFNSVRRE
ncbi:hypothetical protein HWV62_22598 [Athelia sp. TMB]|nr:hypothetical protein HWV62_22598 [Athelia sp. TMB]